MILDDLLGSRVSRDAFMSDHYLKLPFALAGGCQHLAPLGQWDGLSQILAAGGADIVVGTGGQQREGPAPTTIDAARQVLSEGFTIGIRHAEKHDTSLSELAAQFREAFAAPIDIHLYCTPANHRGFGWHYDAEEVFVLQLRGSKEWSLRKNTVNPWPLVESLPADMQYEREIMPLSKCLLAAGDWLYIPGGYWHKTEARGEESVSLSVGVQAQTAMDLFDFLRPRLLESLRWRQRLPCGGAGQTKTAAELEELLAAVLSDLGDDLAKLLRDKMLPREYLAAARARSLAPDKPRSG